jgi:hypothetical protein
MSEAWSQFDFANQSGAAHSAAGFDTLPLPEETMRRIADPF